MKSFLGTHLFIASLALAVAMLLVGTAWYTHHTQRAFELDIENNPLYHAKMLGHSKIVEFLEIHLERQTKLREYFNSEIWINDPELFMCLPEQFQSHANILVQLWDNIGRIDITDGKGFSVLPIELFHILLIELYFTM